MKKNFFFITLIIIILDQITKVLASTLKDSIPIINNFFNLTFVKNTGAAFGIFKHGNSFLIFFSLIVIGLILFYYDKIPKDRPAQYLTALILGGAVGNLMDRVRLGFVIDFLNFSFWPAFNIADTAITIGAIGLIIYYWKK